MLESEVECTNIRNLKLSIDANCDVIIILLQLLKKLIHKVALNILEECFFENCSERSPSIRSIDIFYAIYPEDFRSRRVWVFYYILKLSMIYLRTATVDYYGEKR